MRIRQEQRAERKKNRIIYVDRERERNKKDEHRYEFCFYAYVHEYYTHCTSKILHSCTLIFRLILHPLMSDKIYAQHSRKNNTPKIVIFYPFLWVTFRLIRRLLFTKYLYLSTYSNLLRKRFFKCLSEGWLKISLCVEVTKSLLRTGKQHNVSMVRGILRRNTVSLDRLNHQIIQIQENRLNNLKYKVERLQPSTLTRARRKYRLTSAPDRPSPTFLHLMSLSASNSHLAIKFTRWKPSALIENALTRRIFRLLLLKRTSEPSHRLFVILIKNCKIRPSSGLPRLDLHHRWHTQVTQRA